MQLHSHSVSMQLLNQPLSESVIPVIRSDCQYNSQLVSFKSVSQSTQSVLNVIGPLQACHQDFKLPVNTASGQRIKLLRISFGFIFLLFLYESIGESCFPCSQGTGNHYEPHFYENAMYF